jgi:L-ascorbate metabolism protein UlaG (beta-lactamase superfamily)
MIINWFGQSCFKIESEKCVLVTNPLDKSSGLKIPRLSADIVTLSQTGDKDNAENIKGTDENNPFIISGPGEFEIKNVFIYGVAVANNNQTEKNIIYRFESEGISLAHLGGLNQILSNGQLEKFEGIDILMIPVGGNGFLNAKQATELISQIEPRIIIPMCYQLPELSAKNKLETINAFCKEIGICPKETLNKLKISKKDLPQEDLQVIMLQP